MIIIASPPLRPLEKLMVVMKSGSRKWISSSGVAVLKVNLTASARVPNLTALEPEATRPVIQVVFDVLAQAGDACK